MDDRIAVAGVKSLQYLEHPVLDLTEGDTALPTIALGIADDGSKVGVKEFENEDGILIFMPEVFVEGYDVGRIVEDLEGLDFSESALVVVDLFEGNDEAVGETASSIDVGIGTGADTLKDLVAGRDIGSGMDAPAATARGRQGIHGNGGNDSRNKGFAFVKINHGQWRGREIGRAHV